MRYFTGHRRTPERASHITRREALSVYLSRKFRPWTEYAYQETSFDLKVRNLCIRVMNQYEDYKKAPYADMNVMAKAAFQNVQLLFMSDYTSPTDRPPPSRLQTTRYVLRQLNRDIEAAIQKALPPSCAATRPTSIRWMDTYQLHIAYRHDVRHPSNSQRFKQEAEKIATRLLMNYSLYAGAESEKQALMRQHAIQNTESKFWLKSTLGSLMPSDLKAEARVPLIGVSFGFLLSTLSSLAFWMERSALELGEKLYLYYGDAMGVGILLYSAWKLYDTFTRPGRLVYSELEVEIKKALLQSEPPSAASAFKANPPMN